MPTLSNVQVSRRNAVKGSIGVALLLAGEVEVSAKNSEHPALAPGTLDPATEPANWEVEKSYSTEIMDPIPATEYCGLKFFPEVPNSTTAMSGVLMAEDLATVPNMTLVQQFIYDDERLASADFEHVRAEVRRLAAEKYYLPTTDDFTVVRNEVGQSIDGHVAANGTGHALLVQHLSRTILVLRAGAVQNAAPTDALMELANGILEQGSNAVNVISGPETESGPEIVEHQQILPRWQVNGWYWNYGPLDIHPSRYQSPLCEVPAN